MDRNTFVSYLLFFLFVNLINYSKAQGNCRIDGVSESQWEDEFNINIVDTDSGLTIERETSNIKSIISVKSVLYSLNGPPYVEASLRNVTFGIILKDEFKDYESTETSSKMAYQVFFQCATGTRKLTVVYNIRDTNNHAPAFSPTNSYNYSILLPLPQGFPISFVTDIIVRDEDLTTYEITPQIQANDYFDLTFVDADKTGKNFKLALTTKKVLLDFESVTLFMIAFDKDLTGYPSLNTYGQLTITKDPTSGPNGDMEFSDPFYVGLFDNDKTVVDFNETIALSKGYSDDIEFSLEGDGSEYFKIIHAANNITITTSSLNISEDVILGQDAIILSLIASKNKGLAIARTVLSIKLLKDPNCKFLNLDPRVWDEGVVLETYDNYLGDSIRTGCVNIEKILGYTYEKGELNDPPYIVLKNNFDIMYFDKVQSKFPYYEDVETLSNSTMYVTFKCKRNERVLKINTFVKDINNHNPKITSPKNLTYEIFTPIPAGYSISRTYGDLVVTDVDLTNYAINATVTENEYVSVVYRGPGLTKKDYVFDLVTKKRIDSVNGTVKMNLTAVDADLTGSPRRSVTATITLISKN